MPGVEHVVVVMMENRSFDEYFGTFPGAAGFYDGSPSIAQPWPDPGHPLYPFRMSTFTTNALAAPGLGHDWVTNHQAINADPGTGIPDNRGFYKSSGGTVAAMGCYVANDIPYHWALAQAFALCDHYFCSALAGTGPNRLFLSGGTITDPEQQPPASGIYPGNESNTNGPPNVETQYNGTDPILYNVGTHAGKAAPGVANVPRVPYVTNLAQWGSYLADLWEHSGGQPPSYSVYDDWNWQFDGSSPPPPQDDGGTADLNAFPCYEPYQGPSGPLMLGTLGDPNYFAANYNSDGAPGDKGPLFAQHVNPADPAQAVLAQLTWILPPYNYSEHPNNTSADGAYYLAQIVEALMESEFWDSTVLVITYDESDTHFDHLPPPLSPDPRAQPRPQPYEPWVQDKSSNSGFSSPAPIGAGMRVPAIIVSPWTYRRGIVSDQLDHTSIVQLMETVSGVACTGLPPAGSSLGWRRASFANLYQVIDPDNSPAAGAQQIQGLQPAATVKQWQTNANNRYTPLAPKANAPAPPVSQTGPPIPQSCQVIMTSPSYGQGQVLLQAGGPGQPATFHPALIVTVDGFEPTELCSPDAGVNGPNDPSQPHALACDSPGGTCQTRVPVVTISNPDGTPRTDLIAQPVSVDFAPEGVKSQFAPGVPFRFTFTYSLTFSDPASTFSFGSGLVEALPVSASFAVDTTVTSAAELELVTTDDPQFLHIFTDDTFYLSGELRVFPVTAGQSMFGVQLGQPGQDPATGRQDAIAFITSVMTTLNENQGTVAGLPPGEVASFDELNQTEAGSELSLFPATASGTPVFNFALARVHMQAQPGDPATVRVFFRSFRASTTSVQYETPYAYRQFPIEGSADQHPPPADPEHKIPLPGVGYGQDAGEYVTIPFFATERINFTNPAAPMTWQYDTPNVQPIPATGAMVEAYYGCWLDINQDPELADSLLFPQQVPSDPGSIDGPFDASTREAIQAAFNRDLHQCLVAEISYDPITIPDNDTPQYSAWLAQRNLGFLQAPNPGIASSRRALSTFDIRPTSPSLPAALPPDELMIDWASLPAGSTASIYLPAVSANDIMATAAAMYGRQPFTRIDDHTLECAAQGTTFIPIPKLAGSNLCGLLSVDLPSTVRKGEQFTVVVNQVTNAGSRRDQPRESAAHSRRAPITWRTISGSFQLTIPISTKQDILPDAERSLALLRWILDSIPASDRWHPVMDRYVGAFADRVDGLGGDPGTIPPSATGTLPGTGGGQECRERRRAGTCTGKVEALLYDHFGDFEGFILETGDAEPRTLHSREQHVEKLAERAWRERIRMSVVTAKHHDRHIIERMILHAPENPF